MKSKNIHVLLTDKPSRLVLDTINSTLYLTTTKDFGTKIMQFQNIYITSDEEIKDGDWWLNLKTNDIDKCTHKSEVLLYNSEKYKHIKKIILTTDQDLIQDGVQAIDDEFLEWFVKNPSCEWVEIGYGVIRLTENDNKGYWISIPNAEFNMSIEEPKQEHSKYLSCCKSSEECHCDKKTKQETLEEAALDYSGYEEHRMDFIAGAKWQQERMYSEEEVIELLKTFDEKFNSGIVERNKGINNWFEQFKKK